MWLGGFQNKIGVHIFLDHTVQSMDVLLHVENGRPKRPNTANGTYVQDGLRPSLSGDPWEDFFTSRMGRNSYGHRDI